jgi:hypothetical protein
MTITFQEVRNVFELLYFAAGISLVFIAAKGLAQINIAVQQLETTKRIAQDSAKRDAYRLAQQQSLEFGTLLMERFSNQLAEARSAGITLWDRTHSFKVHDGEIVEHTFDRKEIDAAMAASDPVGLLNAFEGFAMFFVTGMADAEIGYRETAIAFCQITSKYMPALWRLRDSRRAMYKSVIELYEMWFDQLQVEDLQATKQKIETTISTVKLKSVRPIGTW